MSDEIRFISRDCVKKTVIHSWNRKKWYEYLEMEKSTIECFCDLRDLDALIDLALDVGDYEWFIRLTDKKNTLLVSKMVGGRMAYANKGEYLISMH